MTNKKNNELICQAEKFYLILMYKRPLKRAMNASCAQVTL